MRTEDFKLHFNKNYKHKRSSFLLGLLTAVSDIAALFLCFGIGFFIVNLFRASDINFRSFIVYSAYFPFFLLAFAFFELYPAVMINPQEEVRKLTMCQILVFIAILGSLVLHKAADGEFLKDIQSFFLISTTRRALSAALLIAMLCSIWALPAMREMTRSYLSRYKFWTVACVVYSISENAAYFLKQLQKKTSFTYKPVLIISPIVSNSEVMGVPVFPDTEETKKMIKELGIKVAVIESYNGNRSTLTSFYRYTLHIASSEMLSLPQRLCDIGGELALMSVNNLSRGYNLLLKRLTDLFLFSFSLPLILPLFIVLSIIIKLSSKGPVFFRHKRVGKNGKILNCIKFRSMRVDAEEVLEKLLKSDKKIKEEWESSRKLKNDPRITRVGKFLRKTSLDELPQLINILLGEMSFVGPRPVTKEELSKYGDAADYILSVKPGLSGMWQISGRNDASYEERVRLDSYYIQNWSVWLDMWIIIKTVGVVLNRKGAY